MYGKLLLVSESVNTFFCSKFHDKEHSIVAKCIVPHISIHLLAPIQAYLICVLPIRVTFLSGKLISSDLLALQTAVRLFIA